MKYLYLLLFITSISLGCKGKVATDLSTLATATKVDYKNINVSEAKSIMSEHSDVVFLDVRTPEETTKGIIPNAVEIDYRSSNFNSEIAKLDKSKKYIVYCKSGGRSARASKMMSASGFTDVSNLKGGYDAWK